MQLAHPEPFGPKWRGRWIWFERPAIVTETATRPVLADPTGSVGLFRRAVEIDSTPADRTLPDLGRRSLRPAGQRRARSPADRCAATPGEATTTSSTSPPICVRVRTSWR